MNCHCARLKLRPLEKFIVPAELDGTRGLYRRPQAQCLLKATNDYQAILAWLRSKHGLTPEQKAHLKARRRQRDVMGNHGVEQGMDWLQALSNTQRAYTRRPSASCSGRSRTRAAPCPR